MHERSDYLEVVKESTQDQTKPIHSHSASLTLPTTTNHVRPLPTAIIHVGPPKTGTSTIQIDLIHSENELKLDNYQIPTFSDSPGKFSGSGKEVANFAFYLKDKAQFYDPKIETTFPAFLERSQNANENIILSSEMFNNLDPHKLKAAIGVGFNIRIVIVYRRFFDWVVSMYREVVKKKQNEQFEDILTWVKPRIHIWNRALTAGEIFDAYKEVFDDIVVLNYHDERSIRETFFCDGVINAAHMCQKMKVKKNELQLNVGFSQEHLRLINEAKAKSIISSNLSSDELIPKLVSLYEEELGKVYDDLATVCAEDDLYEEMLQYAIKEEKSLFPEGYNEEDLQESFRIFKDGKKMCSFDVKAMLEDPIWVNFLQRCDASLTLAQNT